MSPDEPRWWYENDAMAGGMRWLLAPLGQAYGLAARRHVNTAKPYRSHLPVVCVGNFTAGGTGKTPLAIAVARELRTLGREPVFLTRGYSGSIKGPHWIDTRADTARATGDEPQLLAAAAPVMLSRDRRAGAEAIEATPPTSTSPSSPRVIVMDDGLQNPALHKDLAIALVDGRRGLGNGAVIPAGPLRAPLDLQLGLAHCVIINRGRASPDEETPIERQFKRIFKGPVLSARVAPAGDASWIAGKPLLAYAGIANPQRFFSLATELGGNVKATRTFADHHEFTEKEAASLLAEARALGASLVTTDKDIVRLRGCSGARASLCEASRTISIELVLDARNAERLRALLAATLVAPRPKASQSP